MPPKHCAVPAHVRIMRRVEMLTECGCWIHMAGLSGGYTMTTIGSYTDGTHRGVPAHRVMYEHHRGPIPQGLVIDHLCRVRSCVNPWHMEVVTSGENILRGVCPPAMNKRKECCPKCGSQFVLTKKQRLCRPCTNKSQLAWYHRRRAAAAQAETELVGVRSLLPAGAQ